MKIIFLIIVISVPLGYCSSNYICSKYICGDNCVGLGSMSACCNKNYCNITSGYCDVNCTKSLSIDSSKYPSFKCYQACTGTTSSILTVSSTSKTSTTKAIPFTGSTTSISSISINNLSESKSTLIDIFITYTTIINRVTTTETIPSLTTTSLKTNHLDALSKNFLEI